jgi:excisionase family DNA binding protein
MMTLEELARRMGLGMTTVYELAKRDALPIPVVRVGRRYLFSRRAFDRLLEAHHGEPGGGAEPIEVA